MFFDQMKNAQKVDWSDYNGKKDILVKEMEKRELFTNQFINDNNVDSIKKNIDTLTDIQYQNINDRSTLLSNYNDLSNNITFYLDLQNDISNNVAKYHYNDEMDITSISRNEPINNINTILEKDNNMLQLYQNSIYVSSAIACATLLIAAIIIIPLQKNN